MGRIKAGSEQRTPNSWRECDPYQEKVIRFKQTPGTEMEISHTYRPFQKWWYLASSSDDRLPGIREVMVSTRKEGKEGWWDGQDESGKTPAINKATPNAPDEEKIVEVVVAVTIVWAVVFNYYIHTYVEWAQRSDGKKKERNKEESEKGKETKAARFWLDKCLSPEAWNRRVW
jgi:hypothetical protein